ncbi:HlyD family type I secretion periplasmic adaptor subunit [Pseudochelatococcus contaminans]|uniref:Membrane fusion protein (MFP) family protein n=1 Tax=Pseudochelatococcus contaminans TaxID=1538103 RepID=A0A7W6EG62_9HYPH|nr:HlyD family type I secretion periplasmic adaptor subunit [Pseudochelatococcus contaminans]MBB3809241.1 HlyD family secretion protein [Pseudochelatococcus contaminans]
MNEVAPKISSDYRPVARVGYAVIVLTFGLLGGWAALANIDSAVVSSGVVSVESKRKAVQHLEGGIVREINVTNGTRVDAGEVLFRLDATSSDANYAATRHQLDMALAMEARLVAERDTQAEMVFPQALMTRAGDAEVKRILDDQVTQFRERRASLEGQIAVMKNRITQYQSEIEGLEREHQSAEQQLFFIDDELVGVKALAKKGLVSKTRESSLEREKARLDGIIGRNQADSAKARNAIGEIDIQIRQAQQQFQEQVSEQLADVRLKLGDLQERIRVVEDVRHRIDVVAPRAGIVHNLKVFTLGGVVRPGETLLEIVPDDDDLVVEAHIEVTDIDRVHSGLPAEVRFPAFHSRTTPLIMGTLQDISRDRLTDEKTGAPYFLALVAVRDTDVPPDLKQRLRPGMPADVIFPTGERSVLDYLTRPLTEAVTSSFREK